MLKVNFIDIVPKSIFPYQIFPTEFPLPNLFYQMFFTKIDLYFRFTICIFKIDFFRIRLTAYSIVLFFFGGTQYSIPLWTIVENFSYHTFIHKILCVVFCVLGII
jgi:hypothetical protein